MYVDSINISQKSLPCGPGKASDRLSGNLKEENAGKPVKESNSSRVKEPIADVQNKLNNVELNFSVHEPSGKIMVTVINKSSGKVIREIPSSESLDLAAQMDEIVGVFFNKITCSSPV